MKDTITGEADPLNDPLIQNYYQANLNLVRTLGIKSGKSADAQNTTLINEYGTSAVNLSDPTTWKYYLNLSGEYHSTDTQMTITSLDTLLPITFSKENLAISPNTAAEYIFGTRYYQTLVNQYPNQEDVIMGILMPCNINTAINAEDGTILRYQTSLVESNEYSLIKNLEDAIKRYTARVYVDAYSLTDGYYLMAFYANLSLFILPKLFNLRDACRNTYEAHSFHVRMFLRGYMGLDQYYPYLTQKQAMYLYRNLPRLVRYMGYDSQFSELMTNILSPRNIQMFGYTVRQTNQIESDYTPNTIIESEPLNVVQIVPSTETLTPQDLFNKEKTVLYGTTDYYDAKLNDVLFDISHQNQARVITKDVITQTQDTVNVTTLSFNDFILTHWGYMAAVGLYTASVTFQNPRTGTQQTITAKAAFEYLYYLSLSYTSQGMAQDLIVGIPSSDLNQLVKYNTITTPEPVTLIPNFLAQQHVNTSSLISANTLIDLVDQSYRDLLLTDAQILMAGFVPLTITNTTSLFYTLILNVYLNYINQNTLIASHQDPIAKGYVKNMAYNLFADTVVELETSSTTASEFLNLNNLDSYEVVGQYLPQLITNLYQAGTGISVNTSSDQKDVTQAMIKIMRSLTSYNIQYIEIISESDLTLARLEPNIFYGTINQGDGTPDSYTTNTARLPVGVIMQDVTVEYLS